MRSRTGSFYGKSCIQFVNSGLARMLEPVNYSLHQLESLRKAFEVLCEL
jgi:hypothetical protein